MNTTPQPDIAWPYPRWIAHRGAGKLAPENTLAAFRLGASHGFRMFECDAKLSSDGVVFLMHDASLQRTTNAANVWQDGLSLVGGERAWGELSQLDAGAWHSATYAGEPLATLQALARFCIANGYALNIEIKPTPGTTHLTGTVVAQHAAQLWRGQPVPPLLTSFEPDALRAAWQAQPELPRGLLLDSLWDGWLETAIGLKCVAVVCKHTLWNETSVAQAKGAGLKTLSYTVNEADQAQRLIDLGTDGIITDRVDVLGPGGAGKGA